ncbi:MAG: low molecular weight protein-tyrosine-phosphatase [Actinomycetota bacterium]
MASILVVCTGNVCRSPIAEGMLRSILQTRFGEAAPSVASAGTAGWVGSAADPSSIAAAAELGIDISAHRARQLRADDVRSADLVLAMASEHRETAARSAPEAGGAAFALKELVRLLEALPAASPADDPSATLTGRIREADRLRRDRIGDWTQQEGVEDPLGMRLDGFRAVARDLDAWCARLADGLFGRAPARTAAATEGD